MIFYASQFLLGISSLLVMANLSQAYWLLALSLVVLLATFLIKRKLVALRCFFLGTLWAATHVVVWHEYGNSLVEKPAEYQLKGFICSIPIKAFGTTQFDFCPQTLNQKTPGLLQSSRLKLRWGEYVEAPEVALKAGQFWQLKVKLKPAHGRYNPASFDKEKWFLSDGFAATGYIKSGALSENQSSFVATYHQLRQAFYTRINALTQELPSNALIKAISFGERSQVAPETNQLFIQTGTSHLLAISGLHIGIAALWSFWLVKFIWCRSRRLMDLLAAQTAAQIGSLLGAFLLLLNSGLGLPAQRAFIMLAFFIISHWYGRHYRLSSILSVALVTVLLIFPFAVLSASFWLSFSAIFIISCVINRQVEAPSKLIAWLRVNSMLYLALIPISLIFFEYFSLVGIIGNLILIPLVSLVLTPVVYLGLLLSWITPVASGLFWLAAFLFEGILWLQATLVDFNHHLVSYLPSAEVNLITLGLTSLLIVILFIPKGLVSRWILLAPTLLLALSFTNQQTPSPFQMVVFDIGQGLAVFVETPQGRLLYDTGWGRDDNAIANTSILPFFASKQINHLDKLIISHGDSDHAGGFQAITSNLSVGELISGERLPAHRLMGLTEVDCHGFPEWQWGDYQFRFLTPKGTNDFSGNNASCVLSIIGPKGEVLLTGDIEKTVERQLVSQKLAAHQILVAPHHGSNTSSTPEFIHAVAPKQVIFSAGFANQWQFPRKAVVNRFMEQGATIWTTHQHGALIVDETTDRGLRVRSWRQIKPHFWLIH